MYILSKCEIVATGLNYARLPFQGQSRTGIAIKPSHSSSFYNVDPPTIYALLMIAVTSSQCFIVVCHYCS